jgi:hypothetical protein
VKGIKEDISTNQEEVKKYLDSRDWGLAEFYATSLSAKIKRLQKYSELK